MLALKNFPCSVEVNSPLLLCSGRFSQVELDFHGFFFCNYKK